jgi:iron-sulfur cluster insertion protein
MEPIVFADTAINKIRDLIIDDGDLEQKLRIFVQGGGCQGFSYGFTFDKEVAEDDTEIVKDGVTIIVDAMSYQYLVGSTVSYKEELMSSQFVIQNPNSSSTCGCGQSFAV